MVSGETSLISITFSCTIILIILCICVHLYNYVLLLIGNALGEDGIELLRESLDAKGLADALGSLSDDEGVESDEEDEGEVEGGESGEEDVSGEGEADQSREEELSEESPVPKNDDRAQPEQKTVSRPFTKINVFSLAGG